MNNGTKSGVRTSEFWAALAASVFVTLNAKLGWNIPVEAVVSVVGMVASYVLSRGFAKKVV